MLLFYCNWQLYAATMKTRVKKKGILMNSRYTCILLMLSICVTQLASTIGTFAQGLQSITLSTPSKIFDVQLSNELNSVLSMATEKLSGESMQESERNNLVDDLIKKIKDLVIRGASAAVADRNSRTAAHYAAEYGSKKLMQYLLENSDVINALNKKDNNGFTPLHQAMFSGSKDLVEYMMDTSARNDMVTRNDYGMLPIHRAAVSGSKELMQYLIEHAEAGKYINAEDMDGRTVLHWATLSWKSVDPGALAGTTDLIKYLLEHTSAIKDIHKQPRLTGTLLHHAAHIMNKKLVEYLMTTDAKKDWVTKNNVNKTPLEVASSIEESRRIHLINEYNAFMKSMHELDKNQSSKV